MNSNERLLFSNGCHNPFSSPVPIGKHTSPFKRYLCNNKYVHTSIQRTKRYLKVFFRYWEWKVIKVGGTISYCVSYLSNVPLSTRPPPDYNYNSTLLSSVLLNCTFILFLVLSNVWDSAGGRNTKSYFSACSKNNIYFAAQCKCATCLRSVPECNIYLQRVEQCVCVYCG